MKRQAPDGGFDDEIIPAVKYRTLSPEMQEKLNSELGNVLGETAKNPGDQHNCTQVKSLLCRGANPNTIHDDDTLLGLAVDIPYPHNSKLVNLLLSAGQIQI
jgi:hypothetical protein